MSWLSVLSRLRSLSWSDRLLLAETALALASASLAIRFVPFRRLMTSLRPVTQSRESEAEIQAQIARVRWAVQACARRLPWRIVCFQKGLALYRILRRRSIMSVLHYGVTQDGGTNLKAHVWVSRGSTPIIGGDEAEAFVCLASFPSENSHADARAAF